MTAEVLKNEKPLTLKELKSNFYRRASLDTTKNIVSASDQMFEVYEYVVGNEPPKIDITYEIKVDGFESITIGDIPYPQNKREVSVTLLNNKFPITIERAGHATWEFKGTKIIRNDGQKMAMDNPV